MDTIGIPSVTIGEDSIEEISIGEDNNFTFSLSEQRQVTSLSKEYLSQLKAHIEKSEYSLSYEDFINGLEAKGNKYKNFKSAYTTWAKNHEKWNQGTSKKANADLPYLI